MKYAKKAAIAFGLVILLGGQSLAQQIPDGDYSGAWFRKKDGSSVATCTYSFAADSMRSWRCGRFSGADEVKGHKGSYTFNPVYEDGKLIGRHVLQWNGTGFDGKFVRIDGTVTTSGKFDR